MFQSTRPVKGATLALLLAGETTTVSIHAPREGRDGGVTAGERPAEVSIHAPREGRDRPPAGAVRGGGGFNPRAP